jgi:GNAT superfamily N-acetyltransferase
VTVRRLGPGADLRPTRATLAAAFADDPFPVHLQPDRTRRMAMLPSFLGSAQRHCLRYGEVWATDDAAAVACWLSPGRTTPSTAQMLRSGMVGGTLRLGVGGLRRLFRLTGRMDAAHHRAVPGPHWYLFLLAVRPDAQGTGLGRAVLQPVLERADAEGLPCYLDTHNPANPAFYARSGFQEAAGEVVDGVRFWGLLRPPAPAG